MDQNSSNGSVTDKRNWRERLGISTKDMPKIADEFKSERPAPSLGTPVKAAPRPVAKPAPMAPRNAAPAPKPSSPQQSVLADKLRSQREAAEKLAAQRVTAARERAENRIATEPKLATPPAGGKPATPGAKPKFSFADDQAPSFQPRQSSNGLPPLLPPKPALGGDRPPGFANRPAGYGTPNGGYRQEPPPGYRPIDPSTGYPGRPASAPRNYPPLGGAAGPALPQRRQPPPAYDERYYPEEEDYRSDPRLARSMARQQPMADEGDDVFEDGPAPAPQGRKRASAAEYNAAYREAENEYVEPRRRSGGPWLLLFALLLAAVATGGIVWYYQTKIKPVATNTSTGGGSTETVPVVNAPEQAVKTEAETPTEQPLAAQPASKKQIYDRIVGDQEVLGSAALAPTEQTPIQPEPQDAQTGSELIPAPASGQGTDDAEPLPLPPPPGEEGSNTQGNLNNTQVQPASTESASNNAGSESIGSLVQQSASETQAAIGASQATGDGGGSNAAAASQNAVPQLESISDEPAAPDTQAATAEAEQPAETKKPAAAQKKATAKVEKKPAKAKPKTQTEEALGDDPVVLVPPSQDGQAASAEVIDIGGGSAVAQDPVTDGTTTTAEPKKKKTIFDLFKGKDANAGGTAPAQQETQVASAEPDDTATAPAQKQQPAKQASSKTTGGSGYVAQLASFRSQGEAQAEFNRLQGKYPDVLGGQNANISTATVAGSTRYRLGVGPLASRDAAQKICGSLLASGERDCLVRKQ